MTQEPRAQRTGGALAPTQQASPRSEGALKETSALIQLEKRLAGLLGWKTIILEPFPYKGVQYESPDKKLHRELPRWTGDDAAAFQLMVEHSVWPIKKYYTEDIECQHSDYEDRYGDRAYEFVWETIAGHDSVAAAVRVAIVRAVIAKLERNNG